MENNDRQFDNPSGEGLPQDSDPIIQPRDESDSQNANIEPVEAILRTPKTMPLSDVSMYSGRYANSQNYNKPLWTGSYMLKSTLRYKWTSLIIFILVAVPLLALIWTQIVPKYQARAEIRVRPIIPHLVYKTDENGMIPLYNSFLNTQVSIIRSLTVLQRVLDQPKIQGTVWYALPEESLFAKLIGNKVPPLERLRDNLSVRPRSKTEIIDISFTSVSANDAKLVVNAVLEEYLDYVKDKSDATEDKLYDQIFQKYQNLEAEIIGRENVIKGILEDLGTSIPEELVASKRLEIEQLQQERSKIQQNIAILDLQRDKINELLKSEQSEDSNNALVDVSEQRKYYNDAEWRSLNIDVERIEFQIKITKLTDNNPEYKDLLNGLELAKKLRQLRESQIDDQRKTLSNSVTSFSGDPGTNYIGRLESIKNEKELLEKQEQLLKASIDEKQEEFDKIFKKSQLLEDERNELAYTREQYNAVRDRKEQKDMERNVPGSIEVLTSAFVPSKHYNDRRIVFSVMALCFAIGLGLGVAFLRASMNQVIFASKDMPLPIKVPHLGSIPLIRLKNPLGKTLGEEIEKNQIQLFESVRMIRAKLLIQLNSKSSSSLIISSSVAGTGKSSFIKVLGKCLAKTGKSVLMIDTDFYKKTLSKRFGLADKPGIMNCLNSKTLDFSGICKTEIPNLSVLPAGTPENDEMVFGGVDNSFFGTYMKELEKRYSVIILDSSPVLPRADTVIMSHHVNGVILVERELLSRRENMTTSIERINSSGGNIWGVVFVGSSDFENYDKYSGYYEMIKA